MNSLQKTLRVFILLGGLIVLALLGLRWNQHRKHIAPPLPDYGAVSNFLLTDQTGQPYGLSHLKGKFWIADFIFTRCMGPCPLITAKMAELQKHYGPTNKLRFVSFSVDPKYDTPAILTAYAKTYGADKNFWRFLTGDKKKIYALIRESFHLAVEEAPPAKSIEADFIHSTLFVLVDKNARIRGLYNSTDAEALKKLEIDLKQCR